MKRVALFLGLAVAVAGCGQPPTGVPAGPRVRVSSEVSADQNMPYSERVEAAKQGLRKQIEKYGLARVADDLEKAMLVSVRIKAKAASEGELKPGSSKLGGTPDLPEGTAWPQWKGVPMALLAQIRLKDVAPYDPEGRLPKEGMLYFFYEAKEQPWGFDPKDQGKWRVIFYDGDPAQLRPISPPSNLPEESRFRTCKLGFVNEVTLPPWDSRDVERLNLSEKEADGYIDLVDAMRGETEVIHHLLGHPDQIQGKMQLECQLASNGVYTGDASGYKDPRRSTLESGAADWSLLLQIDSDEEGMGTMWGDAGRLYFWIREQDLKKRDFSKVWLVLQCY